MIVKEFKMIYGFEKFSLCDWEGYACPVIFLGGCNFRCPTCHNKYIAYEDIEYNDDIPFEKIFNFIKEKSHWYDGIVISGGEPTIHKDIIDIVDELRLLNKPIKLDTNGSHPEVIHALLDKIKLFAVDVKGKFEDYSFVTGGSVSPLEMKNKLEEVFELAKKYPEKFLFRTTTIPYLTSEDLEIIRSYIPQGSKYILQSYIEP